MSDFDWIDSGSKVYSATFESPNRCYVTSVIVLANSVEEGVKKIQLWRQGNSRYNYGDTIYTSKIKEIEFGTYNILMLAMVVILMFLCNNNLTNQFNFNSIKT